MECACNQLIKRFTWAIIGFYLRAPSELDDFFNRRHISLSVDEKQALHPPCFERLAYRMQAVKHTSFIGVAHASSANNAATTFPRSSSSASRIGRPTTTRSAPDFRAAAAEAMRF